MLTSVLAGKAKVAFCLLTALLPSKNRGKAQWISRPWNVDVRAWIGEYAPAGAELSHAVGACQYGSHPELRPKNSVR